MSAAHVTRARRTPAVRLVPASARYEAAFLAAVRESRALHRPWVSLPATHAGFRAYLKAKSGPRNLAYLVLSAAGDLVGVVSVNEIVRGVFRSGYLAYCAFAPHHRRGFMSAAVARVVTHVFRREGLHRLEANIQPSNVASIRLVRRLGFRREGRSPRYLKIGGRWRDHERWAITREDWRPATRRRGAD